MVRPSSDSIKTVQARPGRDCGARYANDFNSILSFNCAARYKEEVKLGRSRTYPNGARSVNGRRKKLSSMFYLTQI